MRNLVNDENIQTKLLRNLLFSECKVSLLNPFSRKESFHFRYTYRSTAGKLSMSNSIPTSNGRSNCFASRSNPFSRKV